MKAHSPSHFMIGGDLINIGLQREVQNASLFLQNVAPAEQIIYVNGNHDAYTKSTDRRMRKALTDYFRPSPSKIETENFDIITINTGVPTPPFNATGLVGIDALNQLKLMLGKQAKPYILMLHHPLLEIEGGAGHKKMMDSDELIALFDILPPALILHGHTHRNSVHMIGKSPMIGVSSASANKKAAHLASWLLIDDNLKLTLNTYDGVKFDRIALSY
jgi:3',5'-cyclic AMP phosphodiesterase CpdA